MGFFVSAFVGPDIGTLSFLFNLTRCIVYFMTRLYIKSIPFPLNKAYSYLYIFHILGWTSKVIHPVWLGFQGDTLMTAWRLGLHNTLHICHYQNFHITKHRVYHNNDITFNVLTQNNWLNVALSHMTTWPNQWKAVSEISLNSTRRSLDFFKYSNSTFPIKVDSHISGLIVIPVLNRIIACFPHMVQL